MSKTILVTGASSGIGRATVQLFADAGWNVAATMRTPKRAFKDSKNVKEYALDVTKPETIQRTLKTVHKDFGSIDVVVNNAGYGVDGVFEAMDDETIEKQFDTNVFGLMRVTRESIPYMRENSGGTIIQISSAAGRITYPLSSLYHATKWSVEGFTEGLQYELEQFNIRLKLVEPGAIKTEFYGRSAVFVQPKDETYQDFVQRVEGVTSGAVKNGADPSVVARKIFQAATDGKAKLRYPVAYPAPLLLALRKLLPDRLFMASIKKFYKI